VSCGFFPALFTATSATCVTGLVLFDTFTQWSVFGQVVIITLIEIGGLGFMSAASTFVFLLRRKVGLRQKMVIAQSLNLSDMDGVVRIQKLVLT
jgi:trk system potassium uptake protein TrkH